jgi:ADP-ribose pyrophosphatase YjhB (NUDIX family)
MAERRDDSMVVGVLVVRGDEMLLVESPHGWAPPAGHVRDKESLETAAARVLYESIRVRAKHLVPNRILPKVRHHHCDRDGAWHNWEVYIALDMTGIPTAVTSVRWAGPVELTRLGRQTYLCLRNNITQEDWVRSPGLERVWLEIFTSMGCIEEDGLDWSKPW